MAKKKTKNELSVSEFKSWISGIEEMSGDDWSPNKQQWDKIRLKIDLLSDTIEDDVPMVQPAYQTYAPPVNYHQVSNVPQYQPTSRILDNNTIPAEARYADGTISEFF